MVDCEVKVFNRAYSVVAPLCAKNRFVNTPLLDYTKLPASSLYELDNRTVRDMLHSTPVEDYSQVTYQLDVVAKTKEKCREIYLKADEVMIAMNFVRTNAQYITYPDNTEIVRYVARYTAIVDKELNIYRAR